MGISENQWGFASGLWKTRMPFGSAKFAFSLASISLPHKQLMHLPPGLLHSREQEEKGFANRMESPSRSSLFIRMQIAI